MSSYERDVVEGYREMEHWAETHLAAGLARHAAFLVVFLTLIVFLAFAMTSTKMPVQAADVRKYSLCYRP